MQLILVIITLMNNHSAGCIITNSCSFCWWRGRSPDHSINIIEFVEIATTGNAVDFGDLLI